MMLNNSNINTLKSNKILSNQIAGLNSRRVNKQPLDGRRDRNAGLQMETQNLKSKNKVLESNPYRNNDHLLS